mgnify:FL=1
MQGANDVLGADERRAIAVEVRQHIENFMQLANSQDANGEFLVSGFKSKTQPFTHDGVGGFTYHGDDGQRLLKIGDSREVAIGDPGSVFMDFAAAGGGLTNIGEVMYDLATNLEAGNGYPQALTDIDSALSSLLSTRSKVGARMNAVDDQRAANEAFDLAAAEVRSTLEDLDYAEAISRFNQQLTALQASQQSFIKIQDLSLFNFLR